MATQSRAAPSLFGSSFCSNHRTVRCCTNDYECSWLRLCYTGIGILYRYRYIYRYTGIFENRRILRYILDISTVYLYRFSPFGNIPYARNIPQNLKNAMYEWHTTAKRTMRIYVDMLTNDYRTCASCDCALLHFDFATWLLQATTSLPFRIQ